MSCETAMAESTDPARDIDVVSRELPGKICKTYQGCVIYRDHLETLFAAFPNGEIVTEDLAFKSVDSFLKEVQDLDEPFMIQKHGDPYAAIYFTPNKECKFYANSKAEMATKIFYHADQVLRRCEIKPLIKINRLLWRGLLGLYLILVNVVLFMIVLEYRLSQWFSPIYLIIPLIGAIILCILQILKRERTPYVIKRINRSEETSFFQRKSDDIRMYILTAIISTAFAWILALIAWYFGTK